MDSEPVRVLPSDCDPKIKLAAIYLRVSTHKKTADGDQFRQNPEVQKKPLLELLDSRGWKLHRIYEDRGSGAKSRPQHTALMKDARRGLFQAVIVWAFDRFARSSADLIQSLDEFRTLGIGFVSHQQAIDTATPIGKAMFTILAAFAEMERELMIERTKAGMDYARENGTKSGKPIGRPRNIYARKVIDELKAQGLSIRQIAFRMGIGKGSVERHLSQNPVDEPGVTVQASTALNDSL